MSPAPATASSTNSTRTAIYRADRVRQRPLNSPWGLAIAPTGFGEFAGDLLVGNFGDGTINAFNLKTDDFAGTLDGADGKPIEIGDLWALTNGTGAAGTNPNAVYFTAGVADEAHGLFGSLTAGSDSGHSSMSMMPGASYPPHG